MTSPITTTERAEVLDELIERVRGLDGPSQEVDAAITVALDLRPDWLASSNGALWLDGDTVRFADVAVGRGRGNPPIDEIAPITASVDAVLALMERKLRPRWTAWEIRTSTAMTIFHAEISRLEDYRPGNGTEVMIQEHASTPARALLLAVLTALKESSND